MAAVDEWQSAPADDNSWNSAPLNPSADTWEPTLPDDDDDEPPFTGEFAPENISKHADGDYVAADGGCRVCGADGHFARDCPDKKTNSGECYNCGEVGHNKADCPNPRVEREFTGTCNFCEQAGHRAKDCPQKPPSRCTLCYQEGHRSTECTVNRLFGKLHLQEHELSADQAWEKIVKGDHEKEVETIRQGILQYAKAYPEATFIDLESAFRGSDMNTYLIAKQQEVSDTHTIVNLQGEIDQKYVVSIQFSSQPRRMKFAEGWPSTPEDNLSRLEEAGFVRDRGVPKCTNCNQLGHQNRQCPEEKAEKKEPAITCSVCNNEGHRARDCTEPRRAGGKECRHCGEVGHIAKDCPTKEPETCRNCGEEGHRAKDCEKERVMKCRNCDEEGHAARECPHPRDMSRVQCRNCDEMGHQSRECPKPTDWSRVECTNCHEKGHSYKRCPKPETNEDAGDGQGDGGWGGSSGGAGNDGDPWGQPVAATDQANGGW